MLPLKPGPIGRNPALVVIDVQYDFTDPKAPVSCPACSVKGGTKQVIKNIKKVVDAARKANIPIIFTKESHNPDFSDYGSELLSVELSHTLSGTKAEKVVDVFKVERDMKGVAPGYLARPAEYFEHKRRYNIFFRTNIEHILKTYDIDSIIVTGVATNVCVLFSSQGAHERDYVFRVIRECTAGTDDYMHEAALKFLDYLQPGGVQSMDAVLKALKKYKGNPIVKRVKKTGVVYPKPAVKKKLKKK